MPRHVTITLGWEIVECGDVGAILVVFVDDEPISVLPLTEEEVERLLN